MEGAEKESSLLTLLTQPLDPKPGNPWPPPLTKAPSGVGEVCDLPQGAEYNETKGEETRAIAFLKIHPQEQSNH